MPRGPRLTLPWKPKEWRPEYERVVALSCMGKSNTEVALLTNFTSQHVSNILNLDEAAVFRKQVLDKMRERSMMDIPEQMERLKGNIVKRLNEAMTDDVLFQDSPFALLDRGIRVLEGSKVLDKGGAVTNVQVNNQNNSTMVLPTESANTLIEGLRKADEVKRVHAPSEAT